jgi:hypothetical protein
MAQKPDLDEPTRQIAERLLNMPPKQHKDMKVGKHKAKVSPKASRPKKGGRPRKEKNPVKQSRGKRGFTTSKYVETTLDF